MPHETKRWKCDFCMKTFRQKSSATRHEKKCYSNPAAKACKTCEHFTSIFDDVIIDHENNQKTYSFPFCNFSQEKLGVYQEKKFCFNCKDWKLSDVNKMEA